MVSYAYSPIARLPEDLIGLPQFFPKPSLRGAIVQTHALASPSASGFGRWDNSRGHQDDDRTRLYGGYAMPNAPRQMPRHVEAAYKDAVDNIVFLKRQQWVTTNYAVLIYAAIL